LSSFDFLECRDTPAGTVTGSFANGTWTLTGDAQANSIRINPGATADAFTVTGLDNTTVTGATNPAGVRNIVVKLFAGADYVELNDTGIVRKLAGFVAIDGGTDANYVHLRRLDIGKDVTVRNGNHSVGIDRFYLEDSIVRGNVAVSNGDGDSDTNIYRTSTGPSFIGKSLIVTNGAGFDDNQVTDTNIGGNVVIKNGLADPGVGAGNTYLFSEVTTTARLVVGGSVQISNQGSGFGASVGIWDYEVKGNVAINHGGVAAATFLDGNRVNQPVLIRGSLAVAGQGAIDLTIGLNNLNTGLIVGQHLTITTGSASDIIHISRLRVHGATRIQTGSEADDIQIDDSRFLGLSSPVSPFAFQLLTGAGNDLVNIEARAATSAPSQIVGPALVNLGAGNDTLTIGFAGDTSRRLQLFSVGFLFGGADTDTLNRFYLDAVFKLPIRVLFETVNR
jgi:hypothetical protein